MRTESEVGQGHNTPSTSPWRRALEGFGSVLLVSLVPWEDLEFPDRHVRPMPLIKWEPWVALLRMNGDEEAFESFFGVSLEPLGSSFVVILDRAQVSQRLRL